jgi:hypothetical protein
VHFVLDIYLPISRGIESAAYVLITGSLAINALRFASGAQPINNPNPNPTLENMTVKIGFFVVTKHPNPKPKPKPLAIFSAQTIKIVKINMENDLSNSSLFLNAVPNNKVCLATCNLNQVSDKKRRQSHSLLSFMLLIFSYS